MSKEISKIKKKKRSHKLHALRDQKLDDRGNSGHKWYVKDKSSESEL